VSPFLRGILGAASGGGGGGLPVTHDLVLHLDATQIAGVADGDRLTQWDDLSGAARHATASGTARPRYDADGFGTLPGVRFGPATTEALSVSIPTSLKSAEVFVVALDLLRTPFDTTRSGFWKLGTAAGINHHPFGDGVIYEGAFNSGRDLSGAPATPLTRAHVYHVSHKSSLRAIRLNGTTIQSNGAGGDVSLPVTSLLGGDGTNVHNGWLAEVIVYGNTSSNVDVLSSGERTAVLNALTAKWGTTAPASPAESVLLAAAPSPAYWYSPAGPTYADTAGTTSATDAGVVQRWDDRISGRQATITGGTTSRAPVRVAEQVRGRDVARFDASDDSLNPNSYSVAAPYTVVVAYAPRTTSGNHRTLNGATTNWLIGPRSGFHTFFAGSGFVSQTHASAAATAGQYAVCVAQAGTSAGSGLFRVNGVDCTQSNTPSGSPGVVYIGGGVGLFAEPSDADIAHVLVWPRLLSLTEIQAVEAWIAADLQI
jgi:hypothetical protein